MRLLTSWDSLNSLVGTSSEGADLDFKETLDPRKERIEFAKDVAALANTFGGHVLVGVSTDMNRTRCTGFHGVEKGLATEIAEVFERQVKERCLPTPIFNVRPFELQASTKVVIVVAVEASARAPIGVHLRHDNAGPLVDKGWAFPYRVGSLTEYLHPDQFGVYESMTARRATAILRSIPEGERQELTLRWVVHAGVPGSGYGDGQSVHLETLKVEFSSIDLVGNAALFGESDATRSIAVPLDQVQTVWRTADGWAASLNGSLERIQSEWEFWPPV